MTEAYLQVKATRAIEIDLHSFDSPSQSTCFCLLSESSGSCSLHFVQFWVVSSEKEVVVDLLHLEWNWKPPYFRIVGTIWVFLPLIFTILDKWKALNKYLWNELRIKIYQILKIQQKHSAWLTGRTSLKEK